MRERFDGKWEVVQQTSWWKGGDHELVAIGDSREEAIGFIKLLGE